MRILNVITSPMAPAGLLGECIIDAGGFYRTVNPVEGDALPADASGFDGLMVMGGPMNAEQDDEYPHFPALLALMRAFDAAAKPVLGVCLGAQLLARAWGGRAPKMVEAERGFPRLRFTTAAATDPLLGNLKAEPRVALFHEDTFTLPAEATLLITGGQAPRQAFRVGNCSYGFQGHIEATPDVLRGWIGMRREQLETRRPGFVEWFEGEMEKYMRGAFEFGREVGARWCDLVENRRADA